MKRYIAGIEIEDGVVIIRHTEAGRHKRLADLWRRFRFMLSRLPAEYRTLPRPFRLIKSLRAALTMARTFDKNIGQPKASSSGPTSNVGNEADSGDSPLRGDTET